MGKFQFMRKVSSNTLLSDCFEISVSQKLPQNTGQIVFSSIFNVHSTHLLYVFIHASCHKL